MGCGKQKLSKYLTQIFIAYCNVMICQQATLSGEAERPKVADAVIEAALCAQEGLLTNDALLVAVTQALGLTDLASNDPDLVRLPGLTLWQPQVAPSAAVEPPTPELPE